MGDARTSGRAQDDSARDADSKSRTADLRGRVPDLRERGADLKERMPEVGAELRSRGSELRTRGGELARQYAKMDISWARCGYARAIREGLLSFALGPLIDFYVKRRTRGREVFSHLRSPVVFVANHSSHLDTPTILRAIPRRWRSRTAVAAAADYFYKQRWKANGVALLFNTVPLGRNGGGLASGATDHVDRLVAQRWNLLMFPEGTRSRDGAIGKVRSGAAVIAAHHDVDIVPIYVSGTHEAMPPGQNWPQRRPGRFLPRRHKVEVRFGAPIRPRDEEHRREVMEEVRAFWERKGLPEGARESPPPAHDVLLMHRVLSEHHARVETGPQRRFAPSAAPPPAERSTPAA